MALCQSALLSVSQGDLLITSRLPHSRVLSLRLTHARSKVLAQRAGVIPLPFCVCGHAAGRSYPIYLRWAHGTPVLLMSEGYGMLTLSNTN
jgi:hypothetical protein